MHNDFLFKAKTVKMLSGPQGEWILSGKDGTGDSKIHHLYMYTIKCVDNGSTKDPFLTKVSDFAVLFGKELDAEVLSFVFILE